MIRSVAGCLLGTAIGDALGLPYEGLTPQRAARLLGPPDSYRLLFGRGMISDDTEHACLVAQALIASAGDPEHFSRALSWRLRKWLWALPAGIGLATLRALLRLSIGVPPGGSGVNSAGNGPAMRSAVLGAAIDDVPRLTELVHRASVITHRDPRAEAGAFAVALAAHHARRSPAVERSEYLRDLERFIPAGGSQIVPLIARALDHGQSGESTVAFAVALGLPRGVTGYINHTVPVAICAWARHPRDIVAAVGEAIRCGGDTDSVAAIVGGLVGTGSGPEGIPKPWLDDLAEWPRTVKWMEQLAEQLVRVLETGKPEEPLDVSFAATLLRNLFFLAVVLNHGLRRLFPPYQRMQ